MGFCFIFVKQPGVEGFGWESVQASGIWIVQLSEDRPTFQPNANINHCLRNKPEEDQN